MIIEGYISYFDIKGFSNKLQISDFSSDFEKYCDILIKCTQDRNLIYRFFSDGVVIYSETLDIVAFYNMAGALSEILYNLTMNLGLVCSGGISCGTFTLHKDKDNVIFAGIPMVEAVRLEQDQNWFGIQLSPRIIEMNPDFKALIKYDFHFGSMEYFLKEMKYPLIVKYVQKSEYIPVKSDEKGVEGFVILPVKSKPSSDKEFYDKIQDYILELKFLKYQTNESDVQTKYNETIDIIEDMHGRWYGFSQNTLDFTVT